MGKPAIDLSGQTFGRLTVVKKVPFGGGSALWECVCTCGETRRVNGYVLRAGLRKSCGCLRAKTPPGPIKQFDRSGLDIEYEGERMPFAEMCRRLGLPYQFTYNRWKRGQPLTGPLKKAKAPD